MANKTLEEIYKRALENLEEVKEEGGEYENRWTTHLSYLYVSKDDNLKVVNVDSSGLCEISIVRVYVNPEDIVLVEKKNGGCEEIPIEDILADFKFKMIAEYWYYEGWGWDLRIYDRETFEKVRDRAEAFIPEYITEKIEEVEYITD